MGFDVKQYVDELFNKGYKKKQLKKHSKNINKIRNKSKKIGKKKALKKQFKYMNKMVTHSQQKQGKKSKKMMSKNAIRMSQQLSDNDINHIWNNTNVPMHNGYANAYHIMHRLDRIESMLSKPPVIKPKKYRGNIHTIHDYK